ncbi:hypothetical protein ACPVTF_03415 [Geobacillus icigianus]|uniref:Uncharacterized protein n=1 Tax=Geobacillus subterraneus TaxID=129338 RepID=A0A679G085_9BACL|nr:hypothetical protein [Geobacillus subterraneus]BBW97381.1 hypothetical protein GsuE55_22140 [Geobacillus subterraneus]
MKNVVIHQIVTYIFTEEQLRAYWEGQASVLPFDELTPKQYMELAEDMLEHSSSSQLKQHVLGGGWRTEEDARGKVIAEDESRETIHVEIVDTDAAAEPSRRMLIDRVREIACPHCSFTFYVRDAIGESGDWTCPSCANGFHGAPSPTL